MFGFVAANFGALNDEEQQRYLQVYCGQCHALGTRLGQHTRLALSHDMTFLALLLGSLYENFEEHHVSGCMLHPRRKQDWVSNDVVDYAADMTVALMYHKLLDDSADDGKLLASLGTKALQHAYSEISSRWPRQCAAMEDGLQRISKIERRALANQASDDDPDLAANIFGLVLGEVFAYRDDFWGEYLRMLGQQLGRFIYMMDAVVDLADDIAKGTYNPFKGRGFGEEELRALLMGYMQDVSTAFERLPLEQDIHLLRNVLYCGVWGVYNKTREADEASCAIDELESIETKAANG